MPLTLPTLPSDVLLHVSNFFATRARRTALLPQLSQTLHANLPAPPLRIIVPSPSFPDLASRSNEGAVHFRGSDPLRIPEIWVQPGTYSIDLGHLVSNCPYLISIYGEGQGVSILQGGLTPLAYDGQIKIKMEDVTMEGRTKDGQMKDGYAVFTHSKYTERRFVNDRIKAKLSAWSDYCAGQIVRVHHNGTYDIKFDCTTTGHGQHLEKGKRMQLDVKEKDIEGGNGRFAHSEVRLTRVELCYYKYGGIYAGAGANVYLDRCRIHNAPRGVYALPGGKVELKMSQVFTKCRWSDKSCGLEAKSASTARTSEGNSGAVKTDDPVSETTTTATATTAATSVVLDGEIVVHDTFTLFRSQVMKGNITSGNPQVVDALGIVLENNSCRGYTLSQVTMDVHTTTLRQFLANLKNHLGFTAPEFDVGSDFNRVWMYPDNYEEDGGSEKFDAMMVDQLPGSGGIRDGSVILISDDVTGVDMKVLVKHQDQDLFDRNTHPECFHAVFSSQYTSTHDR